MTRVSLFTGPVLIAVLVLAVLLAANFFLKQKMQAAPTVDTLMVTDQGLVLSGKPLSIGELSRHYAKDESPREIRVVVAQDLPWGKTWELRDTLNQLVKKRPNLTITGLD